MKALLEKGSGLHKDLSEHIILHIAITINSNLVQLCGVAFTASKLPVCTEMSFCTGQTNESQVHRSALSQGEFHRQV